MEQNTEKRRHERFQFALPCLLSLIEDGVLLKSLELETRNISAGGVFLAHSKRINTIDFTQVDIVIPPQTAKRSVGSGTHISAGGYIVRAESFGVAVAFTENYRVASLDEVLRHTRKKVAWMMSQRSIIGFTEQSNLLHLAGGNSARGRDRFRLEKI